MISSGTNESSTSRDTDPVVCNMSLTIPNLVPQRPFYYLLFPNDLTWKDHIAPITSIAWNRIGTLRRNKFILDKRSLNKIYITYIRPLLEYVNITWDSCSADNKRLLDKIQMEAARITTGATKLSSIKTLYNETGWDTLQSRENKHKLCLYNIINGLTPQYLQNILPPRVHELTRYRLRNSGKDFAIPVSRIAAYYNSFFPSTVRDWKRLKSAVRNPASLNTFKKYINNNQAKRIGSPKHFDYCSNHTRRSNISDSATTWM